ncbi:MAG: hypothetical protein WD065_05830 [Planctomycetaceae bacterium]
MVFLIEYNRREGRLIKFETYLDNQRAFVEDIRLDLELDLNRKNVHHEVVILEAASEEALRKTHQRYFETLKEIVASASSLLQTNGHEK